MVCKNFTKKLYQYTQSKQDYGSLKMPGFMDGYKQAVLDFKARVQNQLLA